MKHLVLFLITIPCLFVRPAQSHAQSGLRVTGHLIDSTTRDSLPFITINLKEKGSTASKFQVSKSDGSFEFGGLTPVVYELSFSATGYVPKMIEVIMTDSLVPVKDLGQIMLSSDIKTLQEARVVAQRPIIRREVDRIAYDMQADPDSKSNSVLEMMRKVPFLSLDGNGNVLMKGSSNYRIFINGKPSGLLVNNPKDVLSSMPAVTIKSIEVITTPPLKYDAEGLAGIINLIVERKTTNGVMGSLSASGRFPQGGPGLGGSVSIKQGKFGITGYGGGNLSRLPATNLSTNRNTFTATPTHLQQNGFTESDTRTAYFGTEVSFEADTLNLLTASFNIYANKNDGNTMQNSNLSSDATLLEQYTFDNDFLNKGDGMDAGINYQRGFRRDKNKLLTFSYNYRNNNADQLNNVFFTDKVFFDDPGYRQTNDSRASEQTGQIDYIQQRKSLVIEAGLKGIFRVNKSDYKYYSRDTNNDELHLDPTRSNIFNNIQNVYGAYNSYTYSKNAWTIKGGVRLEQTIIDADFISTSTQVHQKYLHAIPSVALSYRLPANSGLNFGFSRRIKRPGIQKLNPFVDRSVPNFETTGNPNLRPSLVNNFVLGYGRSKKLDLNIGLGYSFFDNLDFRVANFDPGRNVTTVRFENIGKGNAYVLDLNLKYPFTRKWDASLNSNLTYIDMEGGRGDTYMDVAQLLYNINFFTGFRFEKAWRITANMSIIGPGVLSLQSESNALINSSFTVAKELMQGRLSLSGTIANPFTKYRNNRVETTGNDFFETNITREYFRSFGFNINFRIGQLKENIKKNKRGINNNDLSNSKGGL